MDISKLYRPFPVESIHWRVGATTKEKDKGIALAYLDARDVMQRLDDVCGVNWQCRYTATNPAVCEIGIKIDGEWLWRANGAGATDVEADKGALSDAFKRAAVLWGIGRYLYGLSNDWVAIKPAGRSYALVDKPKLPVWATPWPWEANDAARENASTIECIHAGLAEGGDMSAAAEAWFELDDSDKRALFIAPTNMIAAGLAPIFTTAEIATMRTPEFRKAYYGETA